MKTIKLLLIYAIVAGVFTSCQKEEEIASPEQKNKVSQEVLSKLESLYFNTEGVTEEQVVNIDGSTSLKYVIEGDIAMSHEQLMSMKIDEGNEQGRQYRTYNLVSSPATIRVIGYTGGGGYGLSSKMRTALQWAVNNYNRLNIGLNFTLDYGTNYQSYDMVIYRVPNGKAGGKAGFPSNGDPNFGVQIYSGMDGYDLNTIEHVITHEMGHSVGLRHTDWFSRQSCGQSGESANPDGAVHIPGTPTGFDANSIMLSCFGSGEDGEFGHYDEVALEYLY